MNGVPASLISTLIIAFRSRLALQAEILALRHQLQVLQRSTHAGRRLRCSELILWVWLSRLWPDWRSALLIVKLETVIRWHRQGFRLYWRWKCRRPGRPDAGREVRDLVFHRHRCLTQAGSLSYAMPGIKSTLLFAHDVVRIHVDQLFPVSQPHLQPDPASANSNNYTLNTLHPPSG